MSTSTSRWLFSVDRYEQVLDAYFAGLELRVASGQPVEAIASVASFFVSRVDSKADPLLPAGSDLRGRIAVANAHRAFARYRKRFARERWRALRDAGAHPQRPLWASTGTKNTAYSDALYVEQLIAPDVVNTGVEGVRSFCDSYRELLRCIEAKLARPGRSEPRAELRG